MKQTLADLRFMDAALAQGFSGLGLTAPNPSVGCVIVKSGKVLGASATGKGGRPHAESQALEQAGEAAEDATCYVSLEPCAHWGQTPPCADQLIKAKIARVVIACEDPFAEVDGRGIAKLKEAGIKVDVGLRQDRAEHQHAGFFSLLKSGMPIIQTDDRASLYDCDIEAQSGETEDQALKRLGQVGITRVRRTE